MPLRRWILFLVLAVALVVSHALAQPTTPQVIKTQGYLSDSSGGSAEPANGTYTMTFDLYDADPGGLLISTVGPLLVDVVDGLYDVDLAFVSADFDGSVRYLEITIDPDGGGSAPPETLTPRIQIVSAPYAYVADRLDGMDSTDFATAVHMHSGDDIVGGTINQAFIHADMARDAEIMPTVLAGDGSGSGLDADLLDGRDGSQFIDTSATPQTKVGDLSISGTVGAGQFAGDGSPLTNVDAVTLGGLPSSAFVTRSGLQRTPLQIATLRWYEARAIAPLIGTGSGPTGIVFDGHSIWVANGLSQTVTRHRASDGALEGTFNAGVFVWSMAYDGANIWVSNGDGTLTKLRARDLTDVGTFPAGTAHGMVVYDGANIWVGGGEGTAAVYKLRASDGFLYGSYATGTAPVGIAFDGQAVWVVSRDDNNVTKIRASDGAALGTFAVGQGPVGIAFDGTSIWTANRADDSVTKLNLDGTVAGTFAAGDGARHLVFDGEYIWVSNQNDYTVTKLRASDGSLVGSYSGGGFPLEMVFDGANIWVVSYNEGGVRKL